MRISQAEKWGQKPATKRSRESAQRTLDEAPTRGRGGRRKGAGRPAGERPRVRHLARPKHSKWCPVHVTLRRAKGLPSLREELLHRELTNAIRATRREGFRIVQYSVQVDHVHLVIEAESASVLSSGMRSFAVRVAMRVNRRVLRRRGRVWGDRYHRRDLTSPKEVRHALVYVLANHLKHREPNVGLLDPLSSGPWFTGWMHTRWPPPTEPPSTEPADTWLLRKGWHERGGGFIHLGERPKAARA